MGSEGNNEEVLLKYVYAKLSEAPKLAREFTQINKKPLKYRRAYFRIRKYVEDFLTDKNIENRFIIMPGLEV